MLVRDLCGWGMPLLNVVLIIATDTQSKSIIVNFASAAESRRTDDWFAETGETKRYG
jgi:hypothetical protein